MKYTIGIDMGINNVGWSILNNDTEKIEKSGVRLFNASDSAADRRINRNVRRRNKRKDTRVNDILKELKNIDFPNKNTIDSMLIEKRFKGLTEKIEKQDITNILCYMVSHRGYIPFGDEEVSFVDLDGKLPCEYYYNLFLKEGKYRANNETVRIKDNENEIISLLNNQHKYYKEISGEFINNILNIFKRKRQFYEGPGSINSLTKFGRFKTQEDVKEYLRNKKENPDYEKYIFEDLIGKCKLVLDENCTTKANFYAEVFNLLNDFINISFKNIEECINQECFYLNESTNSYKLNRKGLESVIKYCICNISLTYPSLLKNLFNTKIDNIEGYRCDKNKKALFSTLNVYRMVKKEFEDNEVDTEIINIANMDIYNSIMYQFTVAPGLVEAIRMVKSRVNYNFSDKELKILNIIYPKLKKKQDNCDKGNILSYHSFSETIIRRAINDMLKEQMNFMQVRRKYDYDKDAREYFSKNYELLDEGLPLLNSKFVDDIIASPQVKKSIRQAIKVINAIIKEKEELPLNIVVESTKELNSEDKKKEIEDEQRKNEKLRKNAIEKLHMYNIEDNETNIIKTMLYDEMNGHCAYCNNPLDYNMIMNPGFQIEHILPLSKSSNNSFNNKTISCANCNAKKSNRTPYQFLNEEMFKEYEQRIKSNKNLSSLKKDNLLYKNDISKYTGRFFNRNLRDTAYATTELINQIKLYNYYLQENYNNLKVNTLSIPGQITHEIRNKYKLIKDRDSGPSHHAMDASILTAFSTSYVGQKLLYIQNNDKFWKSPNRNEIMEDVNKNLNNIFINNYLDDIKKITDDDENSFKISRQVDKDYQGELSNANIYKYIKKGEQFYKVEQINDIYDPNLKLDVIEKLLDENNETKTLMIYDNNLELFNRLNEIYNQFKNIKGNPFLNYCLEKLDDKTEFNYLKHGIRSSKNKNSPVVKTLRYYSNTTSPYLLEKDNIKKKDNTYIGLDSLKQACTQVYYDLDNNNFVFLPIPKILFNLSTGKIKYNSKEYKKYYDLYIGDKKVKYITDLYNGNCVEIYKSNGKQIIDYFQYFDKTNNKTSFKNTTYFTKNDLGFSIYDVDVLGNKKKRLTFKKK